MSPPAGAADTVDFDLHGFVRVRLPDPTPRDVAVLTRQLGPLRAPVEGRADITVRFVDTMRDDRVLTFVGRPGAGFTEDTCYLLPDRDGGTSARVRLPFDDVGGTCEITCERRVGHVPHLLAVVNFTALAKGVLPLHASAFTYRGTGVLVAGWAKGGKTETLLAFASRGARYVGDEWVYLTPDGRMYGVPEPIRLWHWQVRQLPGLRSRLSRGTRVRLDVLPAAAAGARRLHRRLPGQSGPASVLRRAAPLIDRQAHVQVPPGELFGEDAVALQGRLDRVLLVASHDSDEVTVEPTDARLVGRRMLASLADERGQFMVAYRQFRFAFPDRSSTTVDRASELERTLIEAVLADRPAHLVRHPYPVDLGSLIVPIESVLDAGRDQEAVRSNIMTGIPGG